jgi:hypothetical protein
MYESHVAIQSKTEWHQDPVCPISWRKIDRPKTTPSNYASGYSFTDCKIATTVGTTITYSTVALSASWKMVCNVFHAVVYAVVYNFTLASFSVAEHATATYRIGWLFFTKVCLVITAIDVWSALANSLINAEVICETLSVTRTCKCYQHSCKPLNSVSTVNCALICFEIWLKLRQLEFWIRRI